MKPPSHLGKASREWFEAIQGSYELEPHRLRILDLAAESYDRAAQARRILKHDGLVFTTSPASLASNPAVSIEETARIAFARLVRELALEDEPPPASAGHGARDVEKAAIGMISFQRHQLHQLLVLFLGFDRATPAASQRPSFLLILG